MSGFELDQE
ncbi:hypothetical protein YPPY06_3222, partial [Yersinia pestis PY-06]